MQEEKNLAFPLYSDCKIETSKAFGLAFEHSAEEVELYLSKKVDLAASSGEKHYSLPVPAVYLIDKNKKVAFSYVNADYYKRLDNTQLLEEIKELH